MYLWLYLWSTRLKFWKIFMNRHLTLKCPPVPPWGHLRVHLRDTAGEARLWTPSLPIRLLKVTTGWVLVWIRGWIPVCTCGCTCGRYVEDTLGVLECLCVFICSFSSLYNILWLSFGSPTRYSVDSSGYNILWLSFGSPTIYSVVG